MTDVSNRPKVIKSEEEWRRQLTNEQYHVTRMHGTERAFSHPYHDDKRKGEYRCVCCGAGLFHSDAKFDSGTGWPSFTQPIKENAIKYEKDNAYGMVRVEVMCNTCDAHLGHVFPDGPEPSGLRYCINSESMQIEKEIKNYE